MTTATLLLLAALATPVDEPLYQWWEWEPEPTADGYTVWVAQPGEPFVQILVTGSPFAADEDVEPHWPHPPPGQHACLNVLAFNGRGESPVDHECCGVCE